jgi:DNA-directed RNA polymerase III subunit RPC1
VTESAVPKRISHIQFSLLGPRDMAQLSHLEVTHPDLYTMPGRVPAAGGCLDARLGTADKARECATCGLRLAECAGHFGHVALVLPVFHIGYMRATVQVLHCVCKSCARVMVPQADRRAFQAKMRDRAATGEVLARKGVLREMLERARKCAQCPHCGAHNGPVKKIGAFKLVHEVARGKAYRKDAGAPVRAARRGEGVLVLLLLLLLLFF